MHFYGNIFPREKGRRPERSEVNRFVRPSVGPSGAIKPRKFERKIYLYISLKVSPMLPGNSEKQSINVVRQREGC